MKRYLLENLKDWKGSKNRKPLIIQGARQVGKTWLMKAFGKEAYENVIYINFESSERLQGLFTEDFNISRILAALEIEANQKISSENTLLIFDEIQEAEKGLTALKYFYEKAPELHIIAAGSLLGISIQKTTSFPVGKVDFLQLFPLSFIEFLENVGEEILVENLKKENWEILKPFHEKIINYLRLYYYVGGMPEVVSEYLQSKDLNKVRELQNSILRGYENDFAKHAPVESIQKIKLVWTSIISQLAKENRKFIYGQLKSGARAKDFEGAIQWLVDAGLILKVARTENPKIPLKAYADFDAFKLFLIDIGLLNAVAKLDAKILLEKNNIMTEFKGASTEQFVCQQLVIKHELYYWIASRGISEIDFLIQKENNIIPIEVKAEENLKSKSLMVYCEKYKPNKALKVSMSYFRTDEYYNNVPLYGVGNL